MIQQTGTLGHITAISPLGTSFESNYGTLYPHSIEFASGTKGTCNSKKPISQYKPGDSVYFTISEDKKTKANLIKILGTESYQSKANIRAENYKQAEQTVFAPIAKPAFDPQGAALGNAKNIAKDLVIHNGRVQNIVVTPEMLENGDFKEFVRIALKVQ
jgi:hypothetical protein